MAHAKPRVATTNENERDMKQDFDIDITTPFQRYVRDNFSPEELFRPPYGRSFLISGISQNKDQKYNLPLKIFANRFVTFRFSYLGLPTVPLFPR